MWLWDAVLVGRKMASFDDTRTLMRIKKVVPITSWDAASKHMESWEVFCAVFLGYAYFITVNWGMAVRASATPTIFT